MEKITCDEVASLMNVMTRYRKTLALASTYPSCSRLRDGADMAAIIEIMQIFNLAFEDEKAAFNILPKGYGRNLTQNGLLNIERYVCDQPQETSHER